MTAKYLILSACFVLAATIAPAADTAAIKANIRKLAAEDFRTRQEGSTFLKALDIRELFYLTTMRDAIEDPEVKHALTEIIQYLNNNNSRAAYRARKQDVEGSSAEAETNWFRRQEKTISATSGKSDISTSGEHAQSFMPTKDKVSAIALPIRFSGSGRGWVRVDLVEDDRGRPTGAILGQSWLYVTEVEKGSPHPYVFEFENIPVRVGSLYWYVTQTITDTTGNRFSQGYRMSDTNPYPKGRLWVNYSGKTYHEYDALFTVYSGTNKCTSLRAPTKTELATIPQSAKTETWTSKIRK